MVTRIRNQHKYGWVRLGAGCVVLGLGLVLAASPAFAAGIFRVNAASVASSPNGQTWANAFQGIQAAVDEASRAGGGEVWVAGGIYTNLGPNAMAVALKTNVEVYGGFAGTEVSRAQRDWDAHETIIDGLNSSTGVTGDNNARIDGFTIQNCYSSFSGGGMYNAEKAPVVANCIFYNNRAYSGGGGMQNNSASPTVINCVFSNNESQHDRGGAVSNYLGSPTYSGCVFMYNTADGAGGGAYNTGGAITYTNCVFFGNASATATTGSALYNATSTTLLMNCTISGNGEGALYGDANTLKLVNCIVWDNTGSQITGGPMDITFSCVQGGHTGQGNISGDPLLNTGTVIRPLLAGSPCIDAGTATGAPATDIYGLSRPFGAGYDMGASEYGALPPPNAPLVSGPASPTSDSTPTWTWTSGGGGSGHYRYGYSAGLWIAQDTTATSFTPPAALGDGMYTLYVQERDASNHWGASGFFSVTINTAVQTVAVPDVVGQADVDAEAAITDAGLTFTVVEQASDTVPAGEVIDQDPAAGTVVSAGSDVTLVVSTGTTGGVGCAGCQTAKGKLTVDDLKARFGDTLLSGLALLSLLAVRRKVM